ncbi:MAG TPA: tRNA pseudouridine(55) synthase TruB [Roseiflexaceae bacterium]|nr:tRNA pseudouridine(55) synthase TruB [Roseiflexaceae bacterium]
MHGFLNIDKPAGMTSHDVVARVRRIARQRRVGHAGTLDPAATGVLVVALGAATRLIEYVQDQTAKRYLAVVRLGASTTTDDAEGEVVATAPLPPLDEAALERTLAAFRGQVLQVPPMYAALHHEGRRLHELARAGVTVERPPRPVTIERLELLAWDPPLLTLDVLCGKGTYIRALARDIGAALGCGGHLAALRRTAVGTFTVETAVPLERLEDQVTLSQALLPPEHAVADWPAVRLDEAAARRTRNGQPLILPGQVAARARAHAPDGSLLALLVRDGDIYRPVKVFDWT